MYKVRGLYSQNSGLGVVVVVVVVVVVAVAVPLAVVVLRMQPSFPPTDIQK